MRLPVQDKKVSADVRFPLAGPLKPENFGEGKTE